MESFFTVKLSVEHLKTQILQALTPEMLGADLQRAVNEAVSGFDFEGEVRKVADDVIRREIESVLRYAVFEGMREPAFRSILLEHVRRSLMER